jgi:glutaredoxin-like protein
MDEDQIIIYGADWCGDCCRTKRFLNEHNVNYRWINIETDAVASNYVIQVNRGMRSIPTVVFGDGSILVEPSNEQLARKLGIQSL